MNNKETTSDIFKNTGSIPFQIVALRAEIKNLQLHLNKHKSEKRKGNEKDVPAKRALLKKVARVRRFLKYLKGKNFRIFEELSSSSSKS